MTYASEIAKAAPKTISLASIRPRRRITEWTLFDAGSNTWSAPWDTNFVDALYDQNFQSIDEATGIANCVATDSSWYHDRVNGVIYGNFTGTNDPTARIVIVEWDLLLASEDINFYRNPNDPNSEIVPWNAGIVKTPALTQGNPDTIFGFVPIQSSDAVIECCSDLILEHMHDWSIYRSQVKIWQCFGDLVQTNIAEVLRAVCRGVSTAKGQASFSIINPMELLTDAYPETRFHISDFANLDPAKNNFPIRKVYGYVAGFLPINIDFNKTASTTVNRDWAVSRDQTDKGVLVQTIDDLSASNTGSRTYFFLTPQFNVGDTIFIDQNATPTYATGLGVPLQVTAVNRALKYIDHTNLVGRVIAANDKVHRGFVSYVTIQDENGSKYPLAFGRDWTESNFANNTKGFTLADNFEAALVGSFPSPFDPAIHSINIGVYGETTVPKKLDNVTDFCAVTDEGGIFANPTGMIWDILTNQIQDFKETISLDETGFLALAAVTNRPVGFAIPDKSSDSFPTYIEILGNLLKTELIRMHVKTVNAVASLTATQIAPTSTADATVTDQEFVNPDFRWDYQDTYNEIVVSYGFREIPVDQADTIDVTVDSNITTYLHRISRSLSFRSLHYRTVDATLLANRLSYIFGERKGTLTCNLPTEFMERVIDDDLDLEVTHLPGNNPDDIGSRTYRLSQHTKTQQGLSIVLDDQKGVEDNEGSWS